MEKKRIEAADQLEAINNELMEIMKALEVLENSLYFASERKDKDITKPSAAAVLILNNMLDKCVDDIYEVSESLRSEG